MKDIKGLESISRIVQEAEKGHRWAWAIAAEELVEKFPHHIRSPFDRADVAPVVLLTMALLRAVLGLFRFWIKSKGVDHWNDDSVNIFIGFGGGSERAILQRISDSGSAPHYVITSRLWDLAGVSHPSIFECVRELIQAVRDLICAYNTIGWTHFRKLSPLYHGARVRAVAWCRACLRCQDQRINCVTIVSMDEVSHAMAQSLPGRVHLKQHGLLKASVALPEVATIECLTIEEERNLNDRTNAKVNLLPVGEITPNLDAPVAHVSLVYLPDEELRIASTLLRSLAHRGVRIVVRAHPSLDAADPWAGEYERECAERSFLDSLRCLRPTFVVSWYSTTLALGLRAGVIPVSVSDPHDPIFDLMIYPMPRRVLFWPAHRLIIEDLVGRRVDYNEIRDQLRAGALG